MARRLEVELTSTREDGTWTWRAAGAKQPRGEMNGDLLYPGAQVGDVCKVEAEFNLDGIDVTETFAPKGKKDRSASLLELISTPIPDSELVTEVKAKSRGRGSDSRDRGDRGGRGDRKSGGDRPRGPKREGARDGSANKDRPPRKPREDERPRPKRLRPKNVHRAAVLATVPEAQRAIADQVIAGGIPAVRAAIEKQNKAATDGTPKVPAGPVLKIAEDLMPKLRTAEWRDRAEAAVADMAELDLRDLRSVVVASDAGARDDETRALAATLKEGLAGRIEADHATWMADLTKAVEEARTVRALRLSSRPVKAGSPLPAEMAKTLAEQASAALGSDVIADRWATVLDAVAYSPLRNAITPSGYPAETNEEFLDAVRSVADRVPLIAGHYGIDPKEAAAAKKRRHTAAKARSKAGGQGGRGRGPRKESSGDSSDRPKRAERSEGGERRPRRDRDEKPRAKKRPKNEALEPGKAAQEARRLAAEAEAKAAEDAAKAAEAPEVEAADAPAQTETVETHATETVEIAAETPAEEAAPAEEA